MVIGIICPFSFLFFSVAFSSMYVYFPTIILISFLVLENVETYETNSFSWLILCHAL